MERLDPSVKHWDDKKRGYLDDRRRGTGITRKGHLDDTIIKEPVSAAWMTRGGMLE